MSVDVIDTLLLGRSPAIQRLRALIARVASRDIAVLITGETGVGKELVAQAIHQSSGRPGPFAPVNISALSDGLFARAMFGHVRGAYSGASATVPGVIATAHEGTLFLDEISRIGVEHQAALLRVLETKEFSRVGEEHIPRRSNFRLVSATNDRLESLVDAHLFRHDLLHRLRGVELVVPTLRDRREDIPVLAIHFAMTQSGTPAHLTSRAVARLCEQDWPGNVRQLRNVIDAAVALADGAMVDYQEIDAAQPQSHSEAAIRAPGMVRREELIVALERANGDKAVVAREYGVHVSTVYRWLARYQARWRAVEVADARFDTLDSQIANANSH